MSEYKKPVCRGSFPLNSACGRCERCDEERTKVRQEDIKTQLKKVRPCFEAWWESEGKDIIPNPLTNVADFVKDISSIAWSNGAYKAEEELGAK